MSSDESLLSLREAVRIAARLHFVSMDCLPKSLVLRAMLLSRGYKAELKIGVCKQDGEFASHAWVEVDGQLLGEPESVSQTFKLIELKPDH